MNHTKKVGEKIKHTKKISSADFWTTEEDNVLTYPDGDSNCVLFKSACEEHLFSLTKLGRIYEIVFTKKTKKRKESFTLMRVL